MKKFTILTSLLALTACGGGSGGGSAPTPVNLNPSLAHGLNEMEFYTSDEETMKFNVDANGAVVSVTTEDMYDGNKITFAHTTGNQFQISNKYFYNLRHDQENAVWVYLNEHGMSGPISEQIVSDTALTENEIREQLIAKTIELFQKNNINVDASVVRAAYESLGALDYHSGHVDSMVMDINSVGKDLQLAYSDFGSIKNNLNGSEDGEHFTEEYYSTYVGGYEPNKLETRPSEDMTFTGAAIATINRFNSNDEESSEMLSRTNDAKLELIGGQEILTMNFSKADNPWYDVELNVSTRGITIHDTDETAARINEAYKIKDGMTPYHNGTDTSYYTNGETVQEATAVSSFGAWNDATREGVEVNSVFGGKVAQ